MGKRHSRRWGFTLVELMAVVAVLMVLVALALPRFRLFIASSRQAEAQTNLGIIATLQQSYQLRFHGTHHSGLDMGGKDKCDTDDTDEQLNQLGFRVVDCAALRYNYASTSSGGGEAENEKTLFPSKHIYPNCGSADEWTISVTRKLTNSTSVIASCHQ